MKEKPKCVYCGAAPVNHTFEYISNWINVAANTLSFSFLDRVHLHASKYIIPLINLFEGFMVYVLTKLGAAHFQDTETITHRTKVVLDEAKKRNIEMGVMKMFGKNTEFCRARFPGHKKYFYFVSLPIQQYLDNSVTVWVDNKHRFTKRFQEQQLPVVQGGYAFTKSSAVHLFRTLQKPVITKPQYGSRARHTTVKIDNEAELMRAFLLARQLCPSVVIEEYKQGSVYRATVIGGKVIGILQFIKPTISADGTHTVIELLAIHNRNKKWAHLTDVKSDEWFIDAIRHQKLTPDSIPEKGRVILLSEHSERPNGGYFIDVTKLIPQENMDIIKRAADYTKLDVIGFDIISEDLTLPYSQEKFVFIEGNSLPFIDLHMEVYGGDKHDTAKAIWDLWKK